MSFFDRYKNKMRRNNCIAIVLISLFFGAAVAATVFFAVNGRIRETTAFGALSAVLLVREIKGLHDMIRNPKFSEFIAGIEDLGPLESVGAQVSAIKQSELAKGDLRFDENYFFYCAGGLICLWQTKDICSVRTICQQSRYKHYFVAVVSSKGTIHIGTTKDYGEPLALSIQKAVSVTQTTINQCK